MEGRKACKVDVRIGKRRNERPISKLHALPGAETRRKFIADINDLTAVLGQVLCNGILFVAAYYRAVINLHRHSPFDLCLLV